MKTYWFSPLLFFTNDTDEDSKHEDPVKVLEQESEDKKIKKFTS